MKRVWGWALTLVLLSPLLAAEEWYDAYTVGLEALKQRQGPRAVEALKRAVKLRPEPGNNVVTYGTNKIDRYYPYLRLAEAYLLTDDPEAARGALKRSEAVGREPGIERASIAVLVESAPRKPGTPRLPLPLGLASISVPLDPDVAEGVRRVESGEFESGIAVLDAAARRLLAAGGTSMSPQLAQAYLYLGIAYIGRSQQETLKSVPPLPTPR
jgi:tetratricopeptide (TPR) repeat protein